MHAWASGAAVVAIAAVAGSAARVVGGSGEGSAERQSTPTARAVPAPAAAAPAAAPAPARPASPVPADLASRLPELRAALATYGRSAPGEWGVVVAPVGEGGVTAVGALQEGRAWSAIKVALLVAFLNWRRDSSGSDGSLALSPDERREADSAIRRSDNLAARALFRRMAAALGVEGARRRLQQVFVDAGDDRTAVASSLNPGTGLTEFGTTTWRLTDAVGLVRALARGCLLSGRDNAYLVGLMSSIRGHKHRWGVPEAFPPNVSLAFKAGWGPEPDLRWLVEEVAIVGEGPGSYVVGIMVRTDRRVATEADPAAYYAGRRFVRSVAAVVARALGQPSAGQPTPACDRSTG